MKVVFYLTFVVGVCNAVHLSDVVQLREKGIFKKVFETGPYNDISQAYQAVKGMKSMTRGANLPKEMADAACKSVKSADTSNLENAFYASEIASEIPSCKHTFSASVLDGATKKLSDESDGFTLYQAVCILRNAGRNLSTNDVMGNLAKSVENVDSSVLASSYALLAAMRLDKVKDFSGLLKQADIKDMAAQSDEVEGQYLHFENDLATTATFIRASYEAAEKIKGVKELEPEQAIMFMNFIVRHKSSASIDKGYYIFSSLAAAGSAKTKIVKAQLVSGNSVSKESPDVKFSVTTPLAAPVDGITVKVESVSRSADNEAIVSNMPLKKDAKSGFYVLKMWDKKPKSGFYDITLNIIATAGQVAGVDDLEFKVKVTTAITIVDVKVASLERDASITAASMTSVQFLKKAATISSDMQQKLAMTFKIQDTMDNSFLKPHQVFVRFVHQTTKEEIIFIAEADSSSLYKFEADLQVAAKEQFNSQSGKYTMELIVGDAAISNPIRWDVIDVQMKFDDTAAQKPASMYEKKKEIKHMFREKEPRPPAVVSTAFTAACLVPILALFIMWGKVGANVSNLSLAPANIVFHLGLGAIFALYYMFWTQFNMFVTVRYLLGIGLLTFLAGNKVLSGIAAQNE